ncbi:hypothetical protein AB0N99_08015 [Streptomyces sp. NPDC093272]|uniref:hypothetical protein n=1 Tax=Streptomyces sp. NPDC093272 TaxID=3154981 RepID=UPI00343AFAFC
MDPLTAVSASRMASGKRFAFYISVQLASVLVPGLVAVTCITALVLHAEHPHDFASAVSRAAQSIRGPAVILLDVSWLASAYVLGYVGREIAFRMLGIAERLSARHRMTLNTLHLEIESAYGQTVVERCLRTHPLLGHLLHTAPPSPRSAALRQPGGALRVGQGYEAFTYAKSWLRQHNPALAPDSIEAEINILLSTLMPLALGTWAAISLASLGATAVTAAVLAAMVVVGIVFAQVLRLRRNECWEALRNLLEDHEMRLAAARMPGSPLPGADAGDGSQGDGSA